MSENLATISPPLKPVFEDVISQLANPELRLTVFGLPRTEEVLDQLEIHCLAFTNVNTPMQYVMGEILEAKKEELGKRYQGWVATKPFSARTEARRRSLYKHCNALLKLHPDDHEYHKELMDMNSMQIATQYAEAFPKPKTSKKKKAKSNLQPKLDTANARIAELEAELESKPQPKPAPKVEDEPVDLEALQKPELKLEDEEKEKLKEFFKSLRQSDPKMLALLKKQILVYRSQIPRYPEPKK